jgi:hypothetical protein
LPLATCLPLTQREFIYAKEAFCRDEFVDVNGELEWKTVYDKKVADEKRLNRDGEEINHGDKLNIDTIIDVAIGTLEDKLHVAGRIRYRGVIKSALPIKFGFDGDFEGGIFSRGSDMFLRGFGRHTAKVGMGSADGNLQEDG